MGRRSEGHTSLSLSPREVLDSTIAPDRSFEEENADDLQFHLDMEYPLAHQRSERVDGRDDVDTPELSSDGTEELPVRLRPNIGLASPRYTSRFFSSCGGRIDVYEHRDGCVQCSWLQDT